LLRMSYGQEGTAEEESLWEERGKNWAVWQVRSAHVVRQGSGELVQKVIQGVIRFGDARALRWEGCRKSVVV